MRKTIVYGILFFQIALIGSLIRGLQLSYKSRERLVEMKSTRDKLVSENEKLRSEIAYVESDYYVEKIAREELHLVRPGEKVVIIPETEMLNDEEQQSNNNQVDTANWQKWWELMVK